MDLGWLCYRGSVENKVKYQPEDKRYDPSKINHSHFHFRSAIEGLILAKEN